MVGLTITYNSYNMELYTLIDLLNLSEQLHIAPNNYIFVMTFVLTLLISYHEPCNVKTVRVLPQKVTLCHHLISAD